MKYRKKPLAVHVEFASKVGDVQTAEGTVAYSTGDALLTGVAGETWPVRREHFEHTYVPMPPTEMGEAGLYVKLPLEVDAYQSESASVVVLGDGHGVLSVKAGDWIVTGPDGRRWVVADEIFQETYVPVDTACEEES
jgi:hypothetical protein